MANPGESRRQHIERWTDAYFSRTRQVIERFGDSRIVYAIFLRRPCIAATRLARDWVSETAALCGEEVTITPLYEEGDWVGAGEALYHLEGSFSFLVEMETLFLQKTGAACIAAYNAFNMCKILPQVAFIAMDARHNTGPEMSDMMSYAASVGSKAAQREEKTIEGFIGTSVAANTGYFNITQALGTMPHALIGYAGSTVRAAEMMAETFPDAPLTVLVDYFGREVDDSLAVCKALAGKVSASALSIRLDTPGGRFCQGLDPAASYDILNRQAPRAIRDYRTEPEMQYLIGSGVSAAAIWHIRELLDKHGFSEVGITASSGFSPAKCRAMALASTPVNVIGTGSFLPDKWSETYATADIIRYDKVTRVKAGREFLLQKKPPANAR